MGRISDVKRGGSQRSGVVAQFEVYPVQERAVARVWNGEESAELEAVELPARVLVPAVERQVQPGLEPVGHAEGKLRHAVERLVGDDPAWKRRGRQALRREVVVPRQIEDAGGGKAAIVDLDFVGLSPCHSRPQARHDERCSHDRRRSPPAVHHPGILSDVIQSVASAHVPTHPGLRRQDVTLTEVEAVPVVVRDRTSPSDRFLA